jgi:tRNA(fMet)-specific endonuclease VapC
MILIDTSAWIDFFRDREPLASLVDEALRDNEAALCGPVEAELRRGFLNKRERTRVLPLLEACHLLTQPEWLWNEAGELGFALRRRGVTPKTLHLLIATYALTHGAAILTADRDFKLMKKAGLPLQLTPL